MCSFLKTIWNFMYISLTHVVEFFFSLYWEGKKKKIPDLDKKHAMLSESACSLAKKIKEKQLKSEDLVKCVIERINQVNPYVNAVVENRFEEALVEARKVDDLIASGLSDKDAEKMPFLGVPFTFKESQATKGMHKTLGLWECRNNIAEEDSEATKRLREAGAIPVASTNTPELLIWSETRNSVYGMTVNPHHTGRSPGASSGGEAALMATYCIPISITSDVGGSTRLPAFCCGLFGHHITPGHTNLKGVFFYNGEEKNPMFSLGCVSKHVEDLAPLAKVLAGDKAPLLNLDREVDIKNIKFYYLESTNDCKVTPISSELKEVMQRVISKISEDVPISNAPQMYTHEGFDHMYDVWRYWISKDIPCYEQLYTNGMGTPNAFVELFKKIFCMSKHCLYTILRILENRILPPINADWAEKLTRDFQQDLFTKLGDNGVLLLPSSPYVANYHYMNYFFPYNVSFFSVVNSLMCTATQVPIGANSKGLPLGIQVLAAPRNDALCLLVAKYLEKEFGGAVMAAKIQH